MITILIGIVGLCFTVAAWVWQGANDGIFCGITTGIMIAFSMFMTYETPKPKCPKALAKWRLTHN